MNWKTADNKISFPRGVYTLRGYFLPKICKNMYQSPPNMLW
uniref:Uncharacterized protein n=1 Tax=Siphoviridae sp. ctqED62 TaxID=2826468 RepID=A0A8S5MR68_9CAUD|nr:MAG TPA: hypothetical protein [Siphoviridae sp. ctqED62]